MSSEAKLAFLVRSYLFRKALRKFPVISQKKLEILFTLWILGGKDKFVPVKTTCRGLLKFHYSADYRNIRRYLLEMSNDGLLIRSTTVRKTEWFKLSVAGVNLLFDFEEALRKVKLPEVRKRK